MHRRQFILGSLAGAALTAGGGLSLAGCSKDPDIPEQGASGYADSPGQRTVSDGAPNIVFISIDDQNDWLGFLNDHPGTRTPNLDTLAAKSLLFSKAYASAPMCLPSRTSLLYGLHPATTGVYDHEDPSRAKYDELSAVTPTLIDHLMDAGYLTYGAGKVFNNGEADRWTAFEGHRFWLSGANRRSPDAPPEQYDPDWISPYDGEPIGQGEDFRAADIDFGPTGVPFDEEPDVKTATWARERLREEHDRPFFLAYGTVIPHEPWRLPQQFFDQHPVGDVVVPELRPDDLADLGPYARDSIIDTFGAFERLQASGQWEEAVQAYQAATSFADHCVGSVLDELAASPYADNTIVVVWSDHGFHLGEKLHLHKFTLWERATHVPLLFHVPGRFDEAQTFDRPVSLIDVGPTLADLIDLELSPRHEGRSLLPLLDDPDLADERPAITTWQEGNHAVRKRNWRYIRYATGESELYDHETDLDEYVNLAGRPDYAAIEQELAAHLPAAG